jgi:hypothetical protein
MAAEALVALSAENRNAGNDVVARLDVCDVGTHRLHDSGRLVAHHHREIRAEMPFHEMEVAVAEPGPDDLDEHLVCRRFVDRQVLDDQLSWLLVEYGCLHRGLPARVSLVSPTLGRFGPAEPASVITATARRGLHKHKDMFIFRANE